MKRSRPPNAYNSTLPNRSQRLRSSGPLPTRGRTKEKKRARYRAFMSSAAWKRIRKAALERAGYRCEVGNACVRCPMTTTLEVHHVHYQRFGGDELPTDLVVACKQHHDAFEAASPHRRRSA